MRLSSNLQTGSLRRLRWVQLTLVLLTALATGLLTTGLQRSATLRLLNEENRSEQGNEQDDGAQRELATAAGHRETRRCMSSRLALSLPISKRPLHVSRATAPSGVLSGPACSEHELRNGLGTPLRI